MVLLHFPVVNGTNVTFSQTKAMILMSEFFQAPSRSCNSIAAKELRAGSGQPRDGDVFLWRWRYRDIEEFPDDVWVFLNEHIKLGCRPEFRVIPVVPAKCAHFFARSGREPRIGDEDYTERLLCLIIGNEIVVLPDFFEEWCGTDCLVTLALKIPELFAADISAISDHIASLFASRFTEMLGTQVTHAFD